MGGGGGGGGGGLGSNPHHSLLFACVCMQDTCTGFLLGGIGEMNNKREPNFLVVDKGEEEEGGSRVVRIRRWLE